RGVARYGSRRMKEMRMQGRDLGCQLMRQHQRLPEPTAAIGRGIAPPVLQPSAERGLAAWTAPHLPPSPKDPQRLLIEIFGQIGDLGADLAMDRMAFYVRRVAQGKDADVEPESLERMNFLRNECLGQARVTLENEGD